MDRKTTLLGKIKVQGRTYKIYATNQLQSTEDRVLEGLFVPDTDQIFLNDEMYYKKRLRISYHEMVHAVMDRAGFSQTSISDDMHELLCEAFSNFIEDNFILKDRQLEKRIKKMDK